ncbi:MAG TPA: hypothetical protein VJT73_10535, partial [Polyangiaceae bacterium]|nr:hypothetical protein [Polyangiaceae bacterium]
IADALAEPKRHDGRRGRRDEIDRLERLFEIAANHKMIGPDFERGVAGLKTAAESVPKPAADGAGVAR